MSLLSLAGFLELTYIRSSNTFGSYHEWLYLRRDFVFEYRADAVYCFIPCSGMEKL